MAFDNSQLARISLLAMSYAVSQGVDREYLLDVAGLSPEILANPDSRISTASMVKLWHAIDDSLKDAELGLNIGRTVGAIRLGLVGYAMYHSRDVRSALHRFAHYMRILSEAVVFTIDETGGDTVLSWQLHPSLAVLRHPVETGVAMVVTLAREISGVDLTPIRVELPASSPESTSAYRALFRCPVLFDRPVATVTFSHEQMQLPAVARDPTLAGYLDELAAKTMAPLLERDGSTVAAVRRRLWAVLPDGRPDLGSIAKDLGISERTLQRRLGDESSSFSSVLNDLRHDLSDELLRERKLSDSETAFLLGYSEPSAFQRAFRRWHNVSPKRFRDS